MLYDVEIKSYQRIVCLNIASKYLCSTALEHGTVVGLYTQLQKLHGNAICRFRYASDNAVVTTFNWWTGGDPEPDVEPGSVCVSGGSRFNGAWYDVPCDRIQFIICTL